MGNRQLKAEQYLHQLCEVIPSRRIGTPGNKDATQFFKDSMQAIGLQSTGQRFDCMDHRSGTIRLSAGDKTFNAYISPHSLGCDVTRELTVISAIEALREASIRDKILLLKGEITREQLMPKNFVFYNPETHQEIFRLLEEGQPAAIITATTRNPELTGAPYPFPMIEDGDFDIPSAYMTDVEGDKLAAFASQPVQLTMDAERIPTWAENVTIQLGNSGPKRVLVCAHIDSKINTPGAVDNACGVIVLMLLAELLKDDPACPPVELLVINGEDHYSAGGEMEYLRRHEGHLDSIRLAINIDGAGYKGHPSVISFYSIPESIEQYARKMLPAFPSIHAGEPWYQSDHMVFALNQVPAMALTTSAFMEMERQIAHTPKDTPDRVDTTLLEDIAQFLKAFILNLEDKTYEAA